ncbi:mitochondrial 37S ribosomal protein uS11m Ecym_2043 [Eremothecium cymbalariae DBVPG|uniref:Small ribosomal subunit protein uS11m n=1 Tax=Eremothecium cymbalariae (strain CBS 270.75 / DBVPG 7215 / KCTC 17166 / NRRL Y-17582) TaxID=931890 RepID=G8JP00_ERECY|nr:Hypothetical protein Ecym_2043 [Eremothecium cymbalariae DBVPG\
MIIGTMGLWKSGVRRFSSGVRLLEAGGGAAVMTKDMILGHGSSIVSPGSGMAGSRVGGGNLQERIVKYVLSCRFTKNNTHFTCSAVVEDMKFLEKNAELSYNEKFLYYLQLPQKVKFHISTGNLGFRKAARGEYEAAFQTSAKALQMLEERGLLDRNVEIVMRDFGKGRQAFIAALNGKEGTKVRPRVSRVADATALKFGGVRAPRPRRL